MLSGLIRVARKSQSTQKKINKVGIIDPLQNTDGNLTLDFQRNFSRNCVANRKSNSLV